MRKNISIRLDKKKITGVIYVLAMFMTALDATITNVALPAIGAEFQVAPSSTGAVNVGYLVSLAMILPIAGWVGDRFGTKKVFLSALGMFTVASLLCGMADSLSMLNLSRVLQGAAGGIITPVGMAILFRTFPPEERAKISRMLILPIAVAPALGPIIGGFLVDQLSWRWAFYVNIPVGILAVFIGVNFLREHVEEKAGRFDLTGFLLSVPGFSMLIYALALGPSKGWDSPEILMTGITGFMMLTALVFAELKRTDPMLDLRLLKDPVFQSMSLISFCSAAALLGMLFIFPLMYQNAMNVSALDTGLTTFPEALGLMTASQLLPYSLKRLGVKRLMILSLTGSILIFTSIALTVSFSPWLIRGLMFCVGLFLGHAVGAVQATAFNHIPSVSMGRATTLFNVQNRLGSVLGVAILASVLGASGSVVELKTYQTALLGTSVFLLIGLIVAMKMKKNVVEKSHSKLKNIEEKRNVS